MKNFWNPTDVPRVVEGVAVTQTSEGVFLANLRSSRIRRLTGTAINVWETIDGERNFDQVCSVLECSFGEENRDAIRGDVRRLLDVLVEDGSLRCVTATPAGESVSHR
ncbi:PqqD family protein [Mycetocola tolaasinivorans]|uniref:PqqD family protein n=1 Tax=Mycetocola tolaasinivorans TaxID=76635 RepID=A0A3L7ADT7_9MICO|nr:PqqD family protein [Mycetocola tolaasinivorans]RLP77811.1 PqqD family protein [Mycetocola tolaasinivorans]